MLRYLRSRIGNSYELKADHFEDFIDFTNLATHGFPQKVSSFCMDNKLGLISIGTKDGRLLIFNANGSQLSSDIDDKLSINSLHFANGSNILMILSTDPRTNTQHILRCQIIANSLNFTQLNKERHLKRITCCEMMSQEEGQSALLIGTVIGNIYALWAHNMELVDYIVFLDTSLKDIPELESNQQKVVNRISVHPEIQSKLYILFNNSFVVFFDILQNEVLTIYKAEQFITFMSLVISNSRLICSHNDGSYTLIELSDGHFEPTRKIPYHGRQCTKISKILSAKAINIGEEFIIFSGGVPCDELGDRHTISIFCADKLLILDFDSQILDFSILQNEDIAHALFVLCEEELVAIDLCDPLWRMLPLPQLHPIHSSPVTCISAVTGISENAYALMSQLAVEQRKHSQIFSNNQWPLKNGFVEARKRAEINAANSLQLVLTGHENGTVNIWMANALLFRPWVSLNTARDFEGYIDQDALPQHSADENRRELPSDEQLEGLPPVRKAGIFDPYSDDHRLTIQKIVFDTNSAEIAIGGRAGQLMVYEGSPGTKTNPPNEVLLLDMTTSDDGPSTSTMIRSESAIQARIMPRTYPPGYCLINNTISQFKPAVPITSIAWDHRSRVLAAGNEFGYAICSLLNRREPLLIRKLLSSSDLIQISNMDGPLSRFKSVKKSIRQSFRKKRRQPETHKTLLPHQNMRPVEREIVQRNVVPNIYGGETPASLVKVTRFQRCNLSMMNPELLLFVGTHGSVVYIHRVHSEFHATQIRDFGEQMPPCPLIKEIRLQHRAPVVAIEYIRETAMGSGRLMVFTEEQVRAFTMPGLKSTAKYKLRLTAMEGSRIKKAGIVQLRSRLRRMRSSEQFMALITNRGEVFLIATNSSLKKQYMVQFTESTDSSGILSASLSNDGHLFFLRPGGSEIERCSLNASLTNTFEK